MQYCLEANARYIDTNIEDSVNITAGSNHPKRSRRKAPVEEPYQAENSQSDESEAPSDLDDSDDEPDAPKNPRLRRPDEWTAMRPLHSVFYKREGELVRIVDDYVDRHASWKVTKDAIEKYVTGAQIEAGVTTPSYWFRAAEPELRPLKGGQGVILFLSWCALRDQWLKLSREPKDAISHTEFAILGLQNACGKPFLALNLFPVSDCHFRF